MLIIGIRYYSKCIALKFYPLKMHVQHVFFAMLIIPFLDIKRRETRTELLIISHVLR